MNFHQRTSELFAELFFLLLVIAVGLWGWF